jgi:hypothetical protein
LQSLFNDERVYYEKLLPFSLKAWFISGNTLTFTTPRFYPPKKQSTLPTGIAQELSLVYVAKI